MLQYNIFLHNAGLYLDVLLLYVVIVTKQPVERIEVKCLPHGVRHGLQ